MRGQRSADLRVRLAASYMWATTEAYDPSTGETGLVSLCTVCSTTRETLRADARLWGAVPREPLEPSPRTNACFDFCSTSKLNLQTQNGKLSAPNQTNPCVPEGDCWCEYCSKRDTTTTGSILTDPHPGPSRAPPRTTTTSGSGTQILGWVSALPTTRTHASSRTHAHKHARLVQV